MHPLVRGAAAAAIFTALASLERPRPLPPPSAAPSSEGWGLNGLPAPCLPGTLPEGPVCLRIPSESEAMHTTLEAATPRPAPAREAINDARIPRRPERPADPSAYLFPVGGTERVPRMLDGLDRAPLPNAEHAGIHLAARPGEKVVLLALDHQQGPADVVFVGDLFGPTVVSKHALDDGGRLRHVLLFHGHLDHAEAGLAPGIKLEAGATLGYARSDNGGGLVDITLEARLVREGATLEDTTRLTHDATALPIDLRNVLPLRLVSSSSPSSSSPSSSAPALPPGGGP